MKLNSLSFSFHRGGAAIAAKKLNEIAVSQGIETQCISQDDADYFHFFKRLVSYFLGKLQFDGNSIKHSLNLFSDSLVLDSIKKVNGVVHIHWINNDTLSVFDLDKIPSGSILTLHDEWLYCGAEHCYKVLDLSNDFEHGYTFFKKGVYGFHWNWLIWKIKKSKLSGRNDVIITAPSNWILERAKSSLILKNLDIRYLPNPIDTEIFQKSNNEEIAQFKTLHGINADDFVFCFGAISGKKNFLKGSHLLDEALKIFTQRLTDTQLRKIKLIDFGGSKCETTVYGLKNISFGHISNPKDLAVVYSISNCVLVPSMVESFGQVAAEALSCETPVICFDTSGLRDIVKNDFNGLVAKAFEPESLAEKILTMFEMSQEKRNQMGSDGRKHVLDNFSYSVVAKTYQQILADAERIKANN